MLHAGAALNRISFLACKLRRVYTFGRCVGNAAVFASAESGRSVTILCAVYNGNLYISSNPGKLWNDDILRDPHVRLKIGDQLFDRTMSLVNDPAEKEAVLQAKEKKYSLWKAIETSKAPETTAS